MIQKRSKKNRTYTRVQRLKKRRKKLFAIIFPVVLIVLLITSLVLLKGRYVSYRCNNLTYAIDYYFTNWKDEDLRINRVQTMTFIDKTEDKVIVEAFGLSHTEPHQRTTLVGELTKDQNGSWVMKSLEKKDTSEDISEENLE